MTVIMINSSEFFSFFFKNARESLRACEGGKGQSGRENLKQAPIEALSHDAEIMT